jgi:RNA polymerase sigma-70 factor, ECF subfamily
MLAPTPANAATTKRVPAAVKELREGLVKLRPELFGRALRMVRSREVAEDLVQDTVERAIRFQDQFQPETNLRAWVHQILFSVFVTRCRRAKLERNAMGVLSTDPCAWTAREAEAVMADLSPPVKRALEGLPTGFRLVVVLVDIEEMSYKAAAKQLRVPVGTVMSRLHRGRRALADAMRSVPGLSEAA